ncbi:CGNR zinc finger domain-containing protein [Kitasatospora sp. NPDC127059]|uniref:CGNR zinc finger domain-containing protein n=1 Tax=unclassified Kitasatospora TaxID=2633591 RepID=UPI00365BE370
MQQGFGDDNPRGLYFLVDLVNTGQDGTGLTAAALTNLVEQHGGPAVPLTETPIQEIREAVAIIAAILETKDADQAADTINALLDQYPAQPRLVRLPHRPWSLHARPSPDAQSTHWLLSTAALALALWLSERGYCAWGRCAAPGCHRYFIDTGRRSPQRYCSTRCGTRVRVAAHRSQQSQ